MWSKILLSLLVIASIGVNLPAQSIITGIVKDAESGETLSFVNIYTSSEEGTYTDERGYYELQVNPTVDTLVFSLLGYKTIDTLAISGMPLNIMLEPSEIALDIVEITGKSENLGKQIIKKAIAQRRANSISDRTYSVDCYRNSLYEEYFEPTRQDTLDTIPGWRPAALFEELATHHLMKEEYKKIVRAELNSNNDDNLKKVGRMSIDQDFKGSNQWVRFNPADVLLKPKDIFLNLYDNTWYNPNIADRPITSPIADGAFATYRYLLKSIVLSEKGDSIFTIAVIPRFKNSASYQGIVTIQSKDYALLSAELSVIASTKPGITDVSLAMRYSMRGDRATPELAKLNYNYRAGNESYRVTTGLNFKNYDLSPEFESSFFNSEIVMYTEESLERDITLWDDIRPFAIDSTLQQFVFEQDSIYNYEHSPEYYRIQDSIYNANTILNYLFTGFGWRNRSKGIKSNFNPVVSYPQFNHVGGFRANIGGGLEKEFLNANKLDLDYVVNYGFMQKDLRGRVLLGYTYLPKKFARVYGGVGNIYDVITFNQTFEALLSPSNLILLRDYKLGHAHEVLNGLYLDVNAQYAIKEPIDQQLIPSWAEEIFGELNEAYDFPTYKSFFIETEFIYKIGQQYISRGPRKLILANNNPVLKLNYRLGIPNVFGSEVDFSRLQLEIVQRPKPTRLGSSNWKITLGKFLHTNDIRDIEHQYFRGENLIFFSNPLNNMQLLDRTYNTNSQYAQAGVVHHFDGFIMDKIPLLNLLQLEVIAGGAAFALPEYRQLEAYIGIGKKFNLFKELVQVAVYRSSAIDSAGRFKSSFVIGANIYDAFNGQWAY